MSESVRVCVIGAGRAGMVHARNVRWHVPRAELVAIVDADLERARNAAEELELEKRFFPDLESALENSEFDAVMITTPTFTHADLAITAANHGKHIFCEKPMALTLEECDRMIEAAKNSNVLLQIGFMRRFDPPFVQAKKQIDEGMIGKPLIVRTLTRGPGLPPPWAHDIRRSNGMLAEVNSHDFDTIRWLGGGEFVNVFARATVNKAFEVQQTYPDFYDTAVVSFSLSNGTFGLLDGLCPADYGYDARAEVVGTEGVLVIGELHSVPLRRVTKSADVFEPRIPSWPVRFATAYQAEAQHFVECILNGKQPQVTGMDGRKALEGVIAANESIRTGNPVSLPLG
ncbi:MAG: Gfo/Idh/MocA family oxidoreductase [Anaerolineales bacterium]|nr:Gfo/Idh/MocA family oxidoreductase [Anaerolineales bacterium]MDW8447204.1 Gfo/Idh/MocA family oxidoreductase [Anaerolineales bacterium]